ncbi:DUF4369 domain-containing protein [Anseongella ginsenosidimutans]|uniref:DUF4369 domain-containing protein n=1 Tax=Anseongella ginsenosidimutans TaxID=496056 RepID=UPI001044881B|nr:DUF4369 domain-containing protein [Anseongella ginsenosidimutans]QEC51477.1 DUF4369 domain-containing protein [Anseongella ginsenosidimutans]
MRNFLILCTLTALVTTAAAQECHYVIEGIIDNAADTTVKGPLRDGDKVFLKFYGKERVDTTTIANGKFRFEGTVPFPYQATVTYQYGGVAVHLDNSRYICKFALKVREKGLYTYDPKIITDSEYHNWDSFIHGKLLQLEGMKKELGSLPETEGSMDIESQDVDAINQAIRALFDEVITTPNKIAEKTWILVSDPFFSYAKYIDFYDQLPKEVKESTIGERFYNKLQRTKE